MRDILMELNISAFVNVSDIEKLVQQSQLVYHLPENILLIAIYVPVFLVALLANILVIAVFIKYRSFRTVTNCFLLNLSVADLFVTIICMPAAIGQAVHSAWLSGDFLCKINHHLQGVAVGASVFTLTAMSLDRYLAIRDPLKRKNRVSKKLTMKVILFIWVICIAIFSPLLYVRKTDGFRIYNYDFVYCLEKWESSGNQRIFGLLVFLLVYLVPGTTIIFCYALMGRTLRQAHLMPELQSRSSGTTTLTCSTRPFQVCTISAINMMKERRKAARTLIVLAMAFAICWLPSSISGVILDYFDQSSSSKDEGSDGGTNTVSDANSNYHLFTIFHKYLILLGHFNSLLNPILYSLLTRNFRTHVKDWAKSICSRGQHNVGTRL